MSARRTALDRNRARLESDGFARRHRMSTTKITKRTVDAAQDSDRVIWIWDSEVRGFGLKVTLGGQKIYVVQYRTGGRETPMRRYTIGKHGSPWTPATARQEAGGVKPRGAPAWGPPPISRPQRRELD